MLIKYFTFRKPGEEDIATGPPQITAIVSYSKGFACACGPGTVHLFEKTDDKDFFKKAREIKVTKISVTICYASSVKKLD